MPDETKWICCRKSGLNQGHSDLQSDALLTELFRQKHKPQPKVVSEIRNLFIRGYIAFNGEFSRTMWISSNGRARALHARGSGIDARILHVILQKTFYLQWQNNCSINSMRLNFVALNSSYFNDKGFYRIRSSLLIILYSFWSTSSYIQNDDYIKCFC